MAKPTRIMITVQGRGPFPLDMLRHDACYPKTQEDVSKIAESFDHPGHMLFVKLTHRLLPHENPPSFPTTDRWASFGWQVSLREERQ